MDAPSATRFVQLDSDAGAKSTSLPPDLLVQSAGRLRTQALLYGSAFLISGGLPLLISAPDRAYVLASPMRWAPMAVSVLAAIAVATATMSTRIAPATVLTVGLVFEVLASLGIATTQYLDGSMYIAQPPWSGLSWVAVWVLGFTVTVPNPPRRALIAALASVATVPLVVGFVMGTGQSPVRIDRMQFFFLLVVPYLLVVLIAYVCARVVYNLGTALTRARELGSYRLTARLGEGGMGEVWRAEHRLLARPAAVKLMRPEMVGTLAAGRRSELHARFEREAQTTASLRSPHTVELYDFGVADRGTLYYVMELLDGFDLGTLIDRFGPVPPERAVHLLTQMCHSLDEAHGAGLIHRDIKPANVYACRHGRDVDFVKVLDFGLVKLRANDEETRRDLTQDRAVGGTPSFMAPEQALGQQTVDRRADIYATGCVAYWLLTGEYVFPRGSSMETMLHHIRTVPAAPSTRAKSLIPQALDDIVLQCLAKNPDDRPASADELRTRLSAVSLPGQWTTGLAREWWQAHHQPEHAGKNRLD